MNARVEPLAPAASPVECVSWLPREELTRMAMLAYEMARYDVTPEHGAPFVEDGSAYGGRDNFRDYLIENLGLLVSRHGIECGCWPVAEGMDRLEALESEFRRRRGNEALADLAEEVEEVEP